MRKGEKEGVLKITNMHSCYGKVRTRYPDNKKTVIKVGVFVSCSPENSIDRKR